MAAKKKQTSSSVSKVHTPALSVAVTVKNKEQELDKVLGPVKELFRDWEGKIELLVVDVSSDDNTQKALNNNEFIGDLKEKSKGMIIGSDSFGGGLRQAADQANGDFLLTMTNNLSVSPKLVRQWVKQNPNGIPDNKVFVASRDWENDRINKSTKHEVKNLEPDNSKWFKAFTNTRIEDPEAPVKLYPTDVAQYLFHQIPESSSCFETEVLHRAEQEGVQISQPSVKFGHGLSLMDDAPKGGFFSSLGRALAYKWNYQIQEPLKVLFSKDHLERPQGLKQPEYFSRLAFSAILILLFFLMPVLSFDYGVTGDENVQQKYGEELVDYYTSFGQDSIDLGDRGTYLYGGFFETMATGAAEIFNPLFEHDHTYEIRHVVNALVGFLVILITGLMGKYFGGWRGGLLALLFIVLSSRLFGHTMNNPKDIPFAAAYIMGIYFMIKFLKEFPKPAKRTIFWLIIAIAFSINIRIGGLLLIAYFGLFGLLELYRQFFVFKISAEQRKVYFRKALRYGLLIIILGYLGGLVFWPYGHQNPLVNPIMTLEHMSDYPVNISLIFQGEVMKSKDIPWQYIPQYLIYTTPLVVLLGIGLFVGGVPFYRKHPNRYFYLLIVFTIVFPFLYIIYRGSNLYDGIRQVLFIYPPLVVISSLAFHHLYNFISQKYLKVGLTILLAGLMALPLSFMVSNHPHQYVYFNQLVGGVKGAFGDFEMDYWGHSAKPAAQWLGKRLTKNGELDSSVNVTMNFLPNANSVLQKYSDSFNVSYTSYKNRSQKKWDYAIYVARFIPPAILKNGYWPPKGTLHEIKVSGKPIAAVIKRNNLHDYYGFQHFKNQEIRKAIDDFEKYLEYDPDHEDVLSKLANCYMQTKQFSKAKDIVDRALEVNPKGSTALAIAGVVHKQQQNYRKAIEMLEQSIDQNRYYAFAYFHLGDAYYRIQQPRKALEYFNQLRKINPQMYKQAQQVVKQCRQMLRQQS